jgi:serine/threonine-protein kinase HipA
VEDGCQLLDRYPADKYRVSVSELMGALEVCAAPAAARLDFLRLVAFSYLVGNGDLHAKNVSVVATAGLVLSPAYDLLTTLPYGDRQLALRMEGRDDNVRTRDFLALARRFAVPAGAVERMLGALGRAVEARVETFVQAGLPARKTSDWQRTTRKRLLDLAV